MLCSTLSVSMAPLSPWRDAYSYSSDRGTHLTHPAAVFGGTPCVTGAVPDLEPHRCGYQLVVARRAREGNSVAERSVARAASERRT